MHLWPSGALYHDLDEPEVGRSASDYSPVGPPVPVLLGAQSQIKLLPDTLLTPDHPVTVTGFRRSLVFDTKKRVVFDTCLAAFSYFGCFSALRLHVSAYCGSFAACSLRL